MSYIDKLILLTFPFMDVGFIIYGIPLRIGELTFLLFFLRSLDLRTTKIHKVGLIIVLLLGINLIHVISIKYFTTVDNTFFFKYIFRNTLYLFAIVSFVLKPIKYDEIKFNFFIKYILWIVSIFYLIEFIDFYLISFNWGELVFVSRQEKSIFNDFIIRFAGPSSEPAYIIPLLSIPLIYGMFKRKFEYVVISMILMLLAFSSFGYLVILFSIIFLFNSITDRRFKQKAKKILYLSLTSIFLVALVFAQKTSQVIAYNWLKLKAYVGIGDSYEWSASQRMGHIKLALDMFIESSWYNMLFGNGTGFYSKMSKEFTKFYLDDAEEAHNLYVSTLTDRGVIGLSLLILLFYIIIKIKIPKEVTGDFRYFFMAIKFSVLVRMIHWFFTGMLWQYYFWAEVAILISASTYYIKISNERRKNRV